MDEKFKSDGPDFGYETGFYVLTRPPPKIIPDRIGIINRELSYGNLPETLTSEQIAELIASAHEKCFKDNFNDSKNRLQEIISGIYDDSTIAFVVSIKRMPVEDRVSGPGAGAGAGAGAETQNIDFSKLADIGLLTIQNIPLSVINPKLFKDGKHNITQYLLNEICRVKLSNEEIIKGISPVTFAMEAAEAYIVKVGGTGAPAVLLVEKKPDIGDPEVLLKIYGNRGYKPLANDGHYYFMRKYLQGRDIPRPTPPALPAFPALAGPPALPKPSTTDRMLGKRRSRGGKRKTRKNKRKTRKNRKKSRKSRRSRR